MTRRVGSSISGRHPGSPAPDDHSLLADDQHLVREGMKCLLQTYPIFASWGSATTADRRRPREKLSSPDVVLVDVALRGRNGGGRAARPRPGARHRRHAAVARSASSLVRRRALKNGARGFVVSRRAAGAGRRRGAVAQANSSEHAALPRAFLERWMKSVPSSEGDHVRFAHQSRAEVLQLVARLTTRRHRDAPRHHAGTVEAIARR